MTGLRKLTLLFILAAMICGCRDSTFTIDAPAGTFKEQNLGRSLDKHEFKIKVQIIETYQDPTWVPGAHIGIYEGERDVRNQVHLILLDTPDNEKISMGYAITQNGKQIKIVRMDPQERGQPILVKMTFRNGIVNFDVNGSKASIKSNLVKPIPFVSTSCARTVFETIQN